MTLTPGTSSEEASDRGLRLVPDQVLYEYDGPAIFTANLGFITALLIKVDEEIYSDIYLAACVSPRKIDALKSGTLSVYGAIESDHYWIVQTDKDMIIRQYLPRDHDEVPVEYFPERGVALQARYKHVPDTIEQSMSFLSAKVAGKSLSSSSIPMSVFRTIINNIGDAFRTILTPEIFENSKGSTFDLDIYAPRLGSVVVSVKSPRINRDALIRRKPSADADYISAVQNEVGNNRSRFLDRLRPVVERASGMHPNFTLGETDFATIDTIRSMIPSDEKLFDCLELTANIGGSLSVLVIDSVVGNKLIKAYDAMEYGIVTIDGKISEINGDSFSFRVKLISGRVTTCAMKEEMYYQLRQEAKFVIGASIIVRGHFSRRKRIDYLVVDGQPKIL